MTEKTINNVDRLRLGDREIILVGTAHVSKESVRLVREIIEAESPDTVSIELCPSRFGAIRHKERWMNMDIVKVIREKKAFLLLSNIMLSAFQRRIAGKLDITPGAEMMEAIDAAESVDAKIHLADRDIRITLARTWRSMSIWERTKLLFGFILSIGDIDEISEEDVERMKNEDMLEMILADVGKSMPVIRKILIDERDQYLTHRIREAPGQKIVAVVGAGHVPGIKKHWDTQVDLEALETLPPKGYIGSSLKWIIPMAILGLLIFGFYKGGAVAGTDMLSFWIMANGILAGIGALIALGHPLTIVTSVLAAPLTSLNPMIAAGWVSGMVEAFSRKPQVKDFESLSNDILTVKGFWKNKVTRILLVVVFTNLGSSFGTLIAIPLMVKALG